MTAQHESETIVGRITRSGNWDRRYGKRCDHGGRECPHIYQQATPADETRIPLWKLAGMVAVCLGWWFAIGWALPIVVIALWGAA